MIRNHHSSLSESWVFSKPSSQDLTYKEMEEELTCPVCLELYADPLMLPCSHSICKACLQDIMTSRAKAEKQGLECPACRQNHYLTAEQVIKLPKNLSLENIVFRYQEICSFSLSKVAQLDSPECSTMSPFSAAASDLHDANCNTFEESREKSYCGMCEKPGRRQAEWFCQQCQVFYCQLCLDAFHPKRGSLSKHKIRKPTLKESVECMLHCPDHNSESASIFCDTCKVVACHLCVCQGPGSHCGHVILDLETARKQLQEALRVAKNQLSTLMTSFSDKNSVIDTHIQDIKDFEESVKNIISSQYNCIISDIAATLNLVKRRSLESISAIANQHSSHFAAHSHQIKTILQQCQHLGAACDSLLFTEETGDIVHENSCPNVQHLRSFSDIPNVNSSKSPESIFSTDDTSDSETNISKYNPPKTVVKQNDSATRLSKSYCHEIKGTTFLPDMKFPAHYQKVSPNKNMIGCINRNGSDLTDNRRSSFSGEQLTQKRKDFMMSSMRTKVQCGKDKPAEKCEGIDNGRRNHEDLKSSEVVQKLSGVSDLKIKEKSSSIHLREDDKYKSCRLNTEVEKTSALTAVQDSLKEKTKPEDQLLLRAVEVGPVLNQVASLIRQNECKKSMETDNTVIPSNDEDTNILTHVSDFHTSCLVLLSNITDHFPSNCPVITPVVRSGVIPLGLSQSVLPLAQSRTLITWGFNSTTFTADPVEGCAQWSVNVDRNSSHIGDIKTGYLFGIGVSTKPLTSKEQVGMTDESHAVACIGGQLVFCQDSAHNVVMPLTDLPICATIAVTISKVGLVMSYKVIMSGLSSAVCGQRIIALDANKCDYSNGNAEKIEVKVYPVFTVSQRVKLQFPVSSNV